MMLDDFEMPDERDDAYVDCCQFCNDRDIDPASSAYGYQHLSICRRCTRRLAYEACSACGSSDVTRHCDRKGSPTHRILCPDCFRKAYGIEPRPRKHGVAHP